MDEVNRRLSVGESTDGMQRGEAGGDSMLSLTTDQKPPGKPRVGVGRCVRAEAHGLSTGKDCFPHIAKAKIKAGTKRGTTNWVHRERATLQERRREGVRGEGAQGTSISL